MERRLLRRSRHNRLIAGVCGGIGERYGIPPFILRLALIAATIGTLVVPLAYLLGWLVIPEGEEDPILDSPYETSGDGATDSDTPEESGPADSEHEGPAQADSWASEEDRGSR